MYFRRKTSASRTYLQIVESRRDGDQVRQQVIATLGRFEVAGEQPVGAAGAFGCALCGKAVVLSAASNEAAIEIGVRRIGPALVFERLWEETGCRAVITALAGQRKHGFALGRAVTCGAAQQFVSGSDRAADRWREDYAIVGIEGLDLIISIGRWPGWARNCRRRWWPHRSPSLCEGRGGGATVRPSTRPADAARSGVHGHHQSTSRALANRRWASAATARIIDRISAADDPCGDLDDCGDGQPGRRYGRATRPT